MADVYDKATRSYTMSRIRKTDTKPELLARKYLFSKGLRYRIYNKKLIGNPDIVLPKYTDYWIPKILKNVERDKDLILHNDLGVPLSGRAFRSNLFALRDKKDFHFNP
ncbi:MAG: hypothetical protein KF845_15255 [Cyclobacteriaceae bacterium]|nr:hypothetical protein [Cyclobacteriaceae bacterium]